MDYSELSLSVALSRKNLRNEDPELFTLYASLIRVGLSISFGAFAIFIIVLIVFAPSLITVPWGQTGTTLFGLLSSAISYKIYRAIKISNSTVLTAGRGAIGPDRLWEKSTETTFRRVFSSAVALGSAALTPYIGIRMFEVVSKSTAAYREGTLSSLGPGPSLSVLISTIAFIVGTLTISLGCLLVFWSLITPLRSALMRGFRCLRLESIVNTHQMLERFSGVSHYSEPEKICETCFSTSFELRRNPDGLSEYELVCSRCRRLFAGVEDYEEYKHEDEAIEALSTRENEVTVYDEEHVDTS